MQEGYVRKVVENLHDGEVRINSRAILVAVRLAKTNCETGISKNEWRGYEIKFDSACDGLERFTHVLRGHSCIPSVGKLCRTTCERDGVQPSSHGTSART